MRRIFQDAACGKEDRRVVCLGHDDLQVATADPRTIADIEADEISARSYASRNIAMALDEIGLVGHILRHVTPTVFLDDQIEIVERRVVVGGINGDDVAAELGFEKI